MRATATTVSVRPARYRDTVSASHPGGVDRRAMRIELAVMLAVTFGVSAAVAVLHLADAVLSGLPAYRVRLNQN